MDNHYNPDQQRAPAGTPNGGQWVDTNTVTEIHSKAANALRMSASDLTPEQFTEQQRLNDEAEILLQAGIEVMPEIQALAEEIALQFDGIVSPPNIKRKERIVEKAIKEYEGIVNNVKDIARNTTAVSADKLDAAIAAYSKLVLPPGSTGHGVIAMKSQRAETDALGYSGTIIRYRSKNGYVVGEMQLNTPEMIYAKEKPEDARRNLGESLYRKMQDKFPGEPGGRGHTLYEEYRVLDYKKGKDAQRAGEIENESREYYRKFRK